MKIIVKNADNESFEIDLSKIPEETFTTMTVRDLLHNILDHNGILKDNIDFEAHEQLMQLSLDGVNLAPDSLIISHSIEDGSVIDLSLKRPIFTAYQNISALCTELLKNVLLLNKPNIYDDYLYFNKPERKYKFYISINESGKGFELHYITTNTDKFSRNLKIRIFLTEQTIYLKKDWYDNRPSCNVFFTIGNTRLEPDVNLVVEQTRMTISKEKLQDGGIRTLHQKRGDFDNPPPLEEFSDESEAMSFCEEMKKYLTTMNKNILKELYLSHRERKDTGQRCIFAESTAGVATEHAEHLNKPN